MCVHAVDCLIYILKKCVSDVYICIGIYIYMCICINTCICVYRYICIYICVYIHVYVCIGIYVYTRTCIYIYTCMCRGFFRKKISGGGKPMFQEIERGGIGWN